MTEIKLTSIKVSETVARKLKRVANAEGRKMYALASLILDSALAGRVADERKAQEG